MIMITGDNFTVDMNLGFAWNTHKMWHSPEYKTWHAMKQRCLNKNHKGYMRYGGRGIGICKEWLRFENFYQDMGNRPKNTSIDRVNNNLGYFKENCQWRSVGQQAANRKRSIKSNLPRGVSKSGKGYRSFITINYKQYYLGTYLTTKEAHDEYVKIAMEWWGFVPSSED